MSRIEQLSLCFRHVHPEDHTVKERFLGFTDCPQLDASALAAQIIGEIHKLGLNIKRDKFYFVYYVACSVCMYKTLAYNYVSDLHILVSTINLVIMFYYLFYFSCSQEREG